MITDVLQLALTVLFGSLAGGITNSIAIWMLFHPYQPPRLFGRRLRALQGAIPKNKARLAAAVGRTVGTRLLTGEDLARTVAEPGFREAFDERLRSFLDAVLARERGPLAEELAPGVAAELRRLLHDAAVNLLARLDAYLESDEFHAAALRWADALSAELGDQPISDVLTPEREAALAERADTWLAQVLGGEGFERTVREYLDRSAERLLDPTRTFQDVVPVGLVAAVERAISAYLPIALERLGSLLEAPGARARVERVLHEILDRFMKDLKFHQRIVAALIITPETVQRVLEAIEAEGANKISELLQDPDVRDAMARSVNDAIVDFLRRPVTSVLGKPGDRSVEEAKETVAGWALNLARDPATRAFLLERLRTMLHAAENRTWGDVLGRIPRDRVADAIVAAARSERARALYRDGAARLVAAVLERPIGRPADRLPPDAIDRLERALADPLWAWIQEQVPPIAQRVDISRRVEQKMLDYPTERLEELIRGVTDRELRLIVRIGYGLGAVIGLVSGVLSLLL